ncbi:MAG TPA: glycoside hydrolase family 3 N-terminal domain-containing protein [Candidatus Dormibacteraeota bacterium]|nr:glycoside hydrolase family 3 N-terminal domain-containing protein [Candidatus Dormibacteraeota bacterium]
MSKRRSGLCLLLLPLTIFMANNIFSQSQSAPQKFSTTAPHKSALQNLTPAAQQWVNATLAKMSTDEKIGQLLFTTYHGTFISTDSPAYQQMLHSVNDLHAGGFIIVTHIGPLGIEKSQAYPTAALNNELQAKAKIPLLIGADFERGSAMRLDEGTSFPTNMALAAAGDPKDAYTMGKITAIEARDVGVHWIYAPVSDVNNNPENPIINTRSFGEDPARVSEFVREYVRGVNENGGLATAKHFPGHGDTAADSHIDLPVIKADRARLDALELVPFRAAIDAGVGSIMTGHLNVPSLEPDPNTPATLSHNILTGVLRDQLGFDGLVITDAMDMGGITVRFAPGEAAVRAVLAGADALLMPPVPDAAYEALQEAVKSGRISQERLDASVRRILEAKARLELEKNRFVDLAALNAKFGSVNWQKEAQDISDRGITLLRDTPKRLPLDGTKPSRALLLAFYADPEPYPGEDLERELRRRFDSVTTLRADTRFVNAANLKLPSPDSYDVALLALFVRVSDRKGNVDVPAEQAAIAEQVYTSGKPVITLAFGSPYLIERFPQADTWLGAFGISDVAQISMGRALFGEIPVRGHLPVTIPGINLKAGFGIEVPADPMKLTPMDVRAEAQLQPAFDVIEAAVKDKVFPGATLAIGYKGKVSVHAFGKLSYDANSPSVNMDTMYDIASLTKVVGTTTITEKLAEGDFPVPLDLDAKVERYLPEWVGQQTQGKGLQDLFKENPAELEWRHRVTVRHLLTHTSGLPAFKEYWRTSKSKQETLDRIFAEPLEYEPGTKMIYSDLGIILLAEIIHRLTGKTLDALTREDIFSPLGMSHTMYLPPKNIWASIAPTEIDNNLRHRLIQGEVHDENAFAIGGVSGHAGLFSTAPDLAAFCQMELNGGVYAHQRIVRRSTIAQFTVPQELSNRTRTLGWVVPSEGGFSGHFYGPHSFGHTGFTGTSIWIDPDRQLFVVLLTNRVHPTRENMKIAKVRPALHDAVLQSLGLASAAAPAN